MIADAAAGKPVYITRAYEYFAALPRDQSDRIVLVIDLLDADGRKAWEVRIPKLELCAEQEKTFVREYVHAETYNILSSIGARAMTVYVDPSSRETLDLAKGLNEAFCVDQPRRRRSGYGRAINVLDRMMAAVRPGERPFRFAVDQLSSLPAIPPLPRSKGDGLSAFRRCTPSAAAPSALRARLSAASMWGGPTSRRYWSTTAGSSITRNTIGSRPASADLGS
jgi:hypothetical protein